MSFTRLYALAADASPETVAAVIADIKRTYGNVVTDPDDASDDTGGVPNISNVDSSGLPWDERIHSSKRTTKADGTWTRRKNVPDATFAKIEAELRAAVAATPTTVATAPQVPVNPTVAVTTPTPVVPTINIAPVQKTKYQSLVEWVSRNTAPSPIPGQQLDPVYIEQVLQANNITGGLAALANNEPFCEALEAAFTKALVDAGATPR